MCGYDDVIINDVCVCVCVFMVYTITSVVCFDPFKPQANRLVCASMASSLHKTGFFLTHHKLIANSKSQNVDPLVFYDRDYDNSCDVKGRL